MVVEVESGADAEFDAAAPDVADEAFLVPRKALRIDAPWPVYQRPPEIAKTAAAAMAKKSFLLGRGASSADDSSRRRPEPKLGSGRGVKFSSSESMCDDGSDSNFSSESRSSEEASSEAEGVDGDAPDCGSRKKARLEESVAVRDWPRYAQEVRATREF